MRAALARSPGFLSKLAHALVDSGTMAPATPQVVAVVLLVASAADALSQGTLPKTLEPCVRTSCARSVDSSAQEAGSSTSTVLRRSLGSLVCGFGVSLATCGGAEAAPAATAMRFQAEYSDQLHPMCERKISVEKLEKRYIAHFSGTDVGPKGIGDKVYLTCEPSNIDKYKLREWTFDGEIVGDRISVGDGIHEGRWNPYSKESPNPWAGIRWKDGNRWIVVDPDDRSKGA